MTASERGAGASRALDNVRTLFPVVGIEEGSNPHIVLVARYIATGEVPEHGPALLMLLDGLRREVMRLGDLVYGDTTR